MTHATFHDSSRHPQAVRLSAWKISLLALLVLGALAGAWWWLLHATPPQTLGQATAETTSWPAWLKQANTYQPPEEPVKPPPPRDETAEQLMMLRRELEAQRQALEALKNKPSPKPAAPPKRPHAPMLYVAHAVQDDIPPANTYTLAPGATKIPCVVETRMNSDVESIFTVKVTTNVYDTATGRHLLIPQGSTVLGEYQSSGLLYGNQRLPTLSTMLTLPSGKSILLDKAPMMDQQGTAGLVSRVNQHWWRNLGAVVIQGVLRGGAQAVQTGIATGGPAGQVGAGVASTTSQYGSQVIQRTIDTRPTIEVDPGELCTIILVKPLQLPAMG